MLKKPTNLNTPTSATSATQSPSTIEKPIDSIKVRARKVLFHHSLICRMIIRCNRW